MLNIINKALNLSPPKYGNYLKTLLIIFIIITVSIIKSFSIWHYDHSFIDETAVVNFAAGFLDCDLNPTWFGYHTLPMYLLSAFYHVIYWFYFAAGYTSTKSEFVSLLFFNDKIFFITARIVFSIAYTAGVFVLSRIIWTKFNSRLSAVIFFIVTGIFPDSLEAANIVRVDTFVFLFLTLTVYFSCFAEKNRKSFVLSSIFSVAAFCSKSPAIVVPFVLILNLLSDIYREEYPKKYLLYYFLLAPICAFVFMPYAFLDFSNYKLMLDELMVAASGQLVHVGKTQLGGVQERLFYIYNLFREQVGFLSLIGTLLYLAVSLLRKEFLFPLIYVIAYAITFTTSLSIDSYWYRPVYPFFIFFTFVAALLLTSKKFKSFDTLKLYIHKSVLAFATTIVAVLLGIIYIYGNSAQVQRGFVETMDSREDTRLLSAKWINAHIPAKSTIWLDGHHVYYFPKILAADANTEMMLFSVFFPKHNYLISEAFSLYYTNQMLSNSYYNVQILGLGGYQLMFTERLKLLRTGDYVVTSSDDYDRYFDENAMKDLPLVTENARAYYSALRRQYLIASFQGKGPIISVYQVNDTFR